jgi:uncharacterized protein (TIGR03435 family)
MWRSRLRIRSVLFVAALIALAMPHAGAQENAAPKLVPMAADADPSFAVATIKLTPPGTDSDDVSMHGDRFTTQNTTIRFLIMYAYGLHPKQISGDPAWLASEPYDIDARPDTPGDPSTAQEKLMLQKLLVERCKLNFHYEKRDISAYALTLGKTGATLTKSTSDPHNGPSLSGHGMGHFTGKNASMADFAEWLQWGVADRPVVNQTGLAGKFNFALNWTPDDSQYGGMGGKISPSDNPLPGLFTAIQEQLGLKLVPEKTLVDVMVIDTVERPSAN